jgi:hypothetical protein
VPVKSARFCVVALEAGLAEILAWERAASMPSAGISLFHSFFRARNQIA